MSYTPFNPTVGKIPFNNNDVWEDSFLVNDTTNSILKSVYGGNNLGFIIDFNSGNINFGDVDYNINGNILGFDFNNSSLQMFHNAQNVGIRIDIADVKLGDMSNFNSTMYLNISDNNSTISSNFQGNDIGLKLDFGNLIYKFGAVNSGICGLIADDNTRQVYFGDVTNNGNGTSFGVSDNMQKLIASANLLTGSSGSVSGQHLKINVGGNDYVIELKNP